MQIDDDDFQLPFAVGTNVAVESDSRLAGPGTVRAREETGILPGASASADAFLLSWASSICVRRPSSNVSMACLVRA